MLKNHAAGRYRLAQIYIQDAPVQSEAALLELQKIRDKTRKLAIPHTFTEPPINFKA